MKRFLLAALVIAASDGRLTLAQAPVVNYSVPAAVLVGQTSDITLMGGNLAAPTALWTNLPGAKIELAPGIDGNGTKADQVVYRCTLAANAPSIYRKWSSQSDRWGNWMCSCFRFVTAI